jgi:purine-binding chemotaxis protein CheW
MNEEKKTELSELLQLVSFKIGEEEFGIEILKVQEIIKMMAITKIPNTPEFIEGIINLRGRISVVDLRVN